MATRQTTSRARVGVATARFETDTLERLAGLELDGRPVLSVYLDLDPSRFPTPGSRAAQLGSLLGEAQHDATSKELDGVEAEVDRIQTMLRSDPAILRGARALAIFSCAEAGILDAVRLPCAVEPMAVVDSVPWLEPLAGIISPGGWAVAVVSRRDARLLRGGRDRLAQFAAIRDELHRRHAQGGWSQARYQRGIEQEVAWHVHGVADRLLRAHRSAPFEHLVIIASDELRPVIMGCLHTDLTDVLTGTVDADLGHATAQEIARAVEPLIEAVERDRERALVAEIEQGLGTGGAAAAGLDEVLSMLEQQRVDTLLVLERPALSAGLCPQCGRLSTADVGQCARDGAALAKVDAVEHAVEGAGRQSVQIVVMKHEAGWLSEHGQIAARLRW
jgi:peptide chain release factor subunit 1